MGERVTALYYPSWADGPPAPDQGWGLGSPGQDGMLAEYVVLPAARLVRIPATLLFQEAACLPCATLTAWTALNGDRPYTRAIGYGDKVLVVGTGAVSLFATLFAKAVGADIVATTSDDGKAEWARALGASDVINYQTFANWGEIAGERVGGFQRVVNAAGSGSLDQSVAALAPGGEIALMGLFEHAETAPNFIALMMKGALIRGTSVGSAMAFKDLVAFIDAHAIKPPIAATYAFADAKAAFEDAASTKPFGKVVVQVSH